MSKKKKKKGKKNKRLSKRCVQNTNVFSLENKIKTSGIFPSSNVKFVRNNMKEKMSDVLLDFAAPFLDDLDDPDDMKKVIAFAAVVWNISLIPESEKKNSLDEITGVFASEDSSLVEHMTKVLLERKEQLFSYNKRFIVDYEFGFKDGLPWLNVASTLS